MGFTSANIVRFPYKHPDVLWRHDCRELRLYWRYKLWRPASNRSSRKKKFGERVKFLL